MDAEASLLSRGRTFAGRQPYYMSGLFFSRSTQRDIIQLHTFVSRAKVYVSAQPSDPEGLHGLIALWKDTQSPVPSQLTSGNTLAEQAVQGMSWLVRSHGLDPALVDAFLASMLMDVSPRTYHTLDHTLEYAYGAAEAPGLIAARVLGVPERALPAAQALARALQWVTFLRNVRWDTRAGRCYIPHESLVRFGLPDLHEPTVRAHPHAFDALMRSELARYQQWHKEAAPAVASLPRRQRVAIQTVADAYRWMAGRMARAPFIVYKKDLKPHRMQLITYALGHSLD